MWQWRLVFSRGVRRIFLISRPCRRWNGLDAFQSLNLRSGSDVVQNYALEARHQQRREHVPVCPSRFWNTQQSMRGKLGVTLRRGQAMGGSQSVHVASDRVHPTIWYT